MVSERARDRERNREGVSGERNVFTFIFKITNTK